MNLREWLFKNRIKIKYFADALDIDRTYIHKIMAGQKKPSAALLEKISDVSNNQVKTLSDLLDPPPVKTPHFIVRKPKKRKAIRNS